jgi:hypothetical protein
MSAQRRPFAKRVVAQLIGHIGQLVTQQRVLSDVAAAQLRATQHAGDAARVPQALTARESLGAQLTAVKQSR